MNAIGIEAAGCWLDGHFGWTNVGRVVEIAMGYGYKPDHPDIHGLLKAFYANALADSDAWDMDDFADEATDYLSDRAPDGFAFHWECGELFMWSEHEIDVATGCT
ncbi:hypothetical protein AB0O76_40475 [Streptomyces sp. NPDC086554]|uniref:hypothetical protein n=1 Tax=Streptomyces sp. NPDC086554 TaxID=3154864 RepID=UPI00343ED6D2